MSERDNRRLVKTWEAAMRGSDGEWDVTTLHSYEHPTGQLPEAVAPRRLIPDRRKPSSSPHKTIFVFGDAQIGYRRIDGELRPLHNEAAIFAAIALARFLKPDVVVDLGDTTDFAELSRFPRDSLHFQGTLQPSLQRTYDMLADFTEATPGAERHMLDSNHVKRLSDFVLKNAADLSEVRRIGDELPALSYPGLLRLGEIGWRFHGGYGSAEYEYSPDLAFKHGTLARRIGGTAVRLAMENYGRNIIQGHVHRMESQYLTDRQGKPYSAHTAGALCRIDGPVPSFHSAITHLNQPLTHYENWQNGVMVVTDYGGGQYEFRHVPIHGGQIRYQGRLFGEAA